MKYNVMNAKTMTLAALTALTFTLNAGSVSANKLPTTSTGSVSQAAGTDHPMNAGVIARYEELLGMQGQLPKAIAYLNAHISEVSKPQATIMVLQLENAIKKQLPNYEKRFEKLSIQKAIAKAYRRGDSFDSLINRVKDRSLIAFLNAAKNSGYKLETAEGFYFPAVDYSKFKPYGSKVNEDIKSYIDIMAIESTQASLKDAAIVIGYQQLINRALSQEVFLAKYPKSNRAAQINSLFQSYKTLTYYGANNTPLFDYDKKTIQPNAVKAYDAILKRNKPGSTPYLATLQKFMDLLAVNKYMLTPEVEKFRKMNVPI